MADAEAVRARAPRRDLDRLDAAFADNGSNQSANCPRDREPGTETYFAWFGEDGRVVYSSRSVRRPAPDRCRAVLTRATWLKAWGTLPTWRLVVVSYSSASRPRSDDEQSCTVVAQQFPVLLGEEPGLRNRLTGLVVMWA